MNGEYELRVIQQVNVLGVVETRVEIVEIGTQGPPGTSFNPRGAWSNTETYQRLDVVVYSGSGFAALAESTGVAPGSNAALWKLLVSKGDPGDVGGSLPWSQITGKPTSFPAEQYTHNQPTPDTVWTVTHNLGKFPEAQAQDSTGLWYGVLDIHHLSVNALEIRWTYPTSGIAFLT